MSKLIDLTGRRFGRLTVIERAEDRVSQKGCRQVMWRCICDCGEKTVVRGAHLRESYIKSCNCLNTELRKMRRTTHGKSGTRLYTIWKEMRARCEKAYSTGYKNYGGRGISVCEEWLHDFQAFHDWAMANGYRDDLSIDRINVNGNYCPENCRWATEKEQGRNKRSNRIFTIKGEKKTLAEWCEHYELKRGIVKNRLKRGWTPEEALGIVPREKD